MDWLERARRMAEQGQMGAAIDLLEQAVAGGEETPAICKELARLCLTVNEVRAFTNYCHEAMRLDPDDGEPYLMMGRVLTANARWAEAVESLEKAATLASLSSEQREEIGTLLAMARQRLAEHQRDQPGYSPLAT